MEQQMSGLVRRPIKAHKGTIVDGQIVYGKDDVESTTSTPKESSPVSTPIVEPAPTVSTPALAVTPPPPPAPTTQQPVQQLVQQPAPQPVPPPPPPPQPVVQPVETPEQAQQVANTFVPDNVKTAPEQALTIKPIALDESKLTDAQKEFARKNFEAIKKLQQEQQEQLEKKKKLQQAAATQSPRRLPQPYRPTQEEQKEIMDLDRLVGDTPEYKLLHKEAREFGNIQQKELGSYSRKINEAARQFGPQSQEFKNAVESMQFQQRLFAKQYKPTLQRLNKLQSDLNNSDAIKNLREARDRIFKRNKIQENVPSQFNKGGMSMEQQMSLFEEGGMKDDGLNRDPISGNEIPPGSLAKEVRDDIPAQLSDGEYVVPADVVQYYGVKFFEDLRAEAKSGLRQMEETGRIGGEPMAVDMTMIAFGQKDEDKKEKKATGGVVGFDNGGVSSDQKAIDASQPKFNPQDYGVLGFTPSSPIYQTGQGQPQQNKTTMTYYHGQTGESKVVTFVNGVVTPASDLQFTQPPWSLNKPTQTQQEVAKDRDDKDTNKTVEDIRKDAWGVDQDKYDFTNWDSDRFFKEAADQLKISMSERVITGVATMVNPLIGGVISQAATADGFVNTQVMINMLKAAGREEDADKMQEMYDTAFNNLGSIQKSMFESKLGQKFLSGGVTIVQGNASTNPLYKDFIGGKTTTTTKAPIKSPEQLKKEQQDNEDRRQAREKKAKEDFEKAKSAEGVKAAKDLAQENIDYAKESGVKGSEDYYVGNKGGLLKRPKRKNKK